MHFIESTFAELSKQVPDHFPGSAKDELSVNITKNVIVKDGKLIDPFELIEEVKTGNKIQMVWGEYCETLSDQTDINKCRFYPQNDISDQLQMWKNYFGEKNVLDENKVDEIDKHNQFLYLFRQYRKQWFAAFDILKSNISVGLENPLTKCEVSWYRDVLSFTDNVKVGDPFPEVPGRVTRHMQRGV
ncbi:MAG: hypothetical protein GY804_04120 [Alphaproteobacteria bacterium]|nr:hypothetical protein [Alphaproteobacteria bacterium]